MTADVRGAIACPFCGLPVSPSAETCPSCGKELPPSPGPTLADQGEPDAVPAFPIKEVTPVGPDELPPGIAWFGLGAALMIVFVGLVLNFGLANIDRASVLDGWVRACTDSLGQGKGQYWRQPTHWPPSAAVRVIEVISGTDATRSAAAAFLDRARLAGSQVVTFTPAEAAAGKAEHLVEANRTLPWLLLEIDDSPLGVALAASFFSPELRGVDQFRWRTAKSVVALYSAPLTRLLLLIVIVMACRQAWIGLYRQRRREEFAVYQKELTARRFSEKAQLDEVRSLVRGGSIAQALVSLKALLESNPAYEDALQLRRLLLEAPEARRGAVISTESSHQSAAQSDTTLYLKVVGTPYAYQAPAGVETISLGRQRRRPGDPPDIGNDVVVRIPGSARSSLRISRRHLQIQRIGSDYFAIIQSAASSASVNGRRLEPGEPTQIHSGDQLNLAEVITLEALIRARTDGGQRQKVLHVEGDESRPGLEMEATLGDMLTEVQDG